MSELKCSKALVSFAKQLHRQKEICKGLKEKSEQAHLQCDLRDYNSSYSSLRYFKGTLDAVQDLSEKFCKALRDAGIDLDQFMAEVESC